MCDCSNCRCEKRDPCDYECEPVMTDCLAKKIECLWKKAFCDATLLPVIGIPSCNKCVMTLTHTLGECVKKIKINGLTTKSILANNAFYSAEVSCGKWLNLYHVVIPNIPGNCGCKSSGEVYAEALIKLGISLESESYDWKGTCPNVLAVNSKSIGMHPIEFTKKQIAAVKAVIENFLNKCCF